MDQIQEEMGGSAEARPTGEPLERRERAGRKAPPARAPAQGLCHGWMCGGIFTCTLVGVPVL